MRRVLKLGVKLLQLCVFFVAVVCLLSVPNEDLPIVEWLCTLVLSKIVGVVCGVCWVASLSTSGALKVQTSERLNV